MYYIYYVFETGNGNTHIHKQIVEMGAVTIGTYVNTSRYLLQFAESTLDLAKFS